MGKNKDKFDLNATNLLAYILKRLKVLVLISLAAAIITGIFSLFIHNRYKSEVVLFPAAQVSVSRTLADANYGKGKGELLAVGEDEELDQLQQMLNSLDLSYKLVDHFNLMEHYKIDTASKGKYKKLFGTLNSNLKIQRTEYGSVSVQVWDEDPKMAANMANYIPNILDTLFYNMERDRVQKSYIILKNEYDSISGYLKKLEDSLYRFNQMGVIDLNPQVSYITKAYYKALLKGRNDVADKAKKNLKVIEDNAAKFVILRDEIVYVQRQQALLAAKYNIAHVATIEKMSRKFVVNTASVSDYKDSPKRSIIVIVAAIIAFFTALLAFIIAENIKKLK